MFIAMQIYKEGERTYLNKVSCREYRTLSSAIKCAESKGKGIPYVIQGKDIVWTPFKGLRNQKNINTFLESRSRY